MPVSYYRLVSDSSTMLPQLFSSALIMLLLPALLLAHQSRQLGQMATTSAQDWNGPATIRVGTASDMPFGNQYFMGPVRKCFPPGSREPLRCVFRRAPRGSLEYNLSDALLYHTPNHRSKPFPKSSSDQLTVAVSMESSVNHPTIDDKEVMAAYDIEMTYRLCSQVPMRYSDYFLEDGRHLLNTPRRFSLKQSAIAYMNSNCGAHNQRHAIMKVLLGMVQQLPVHSYGRCDNNKPMPADLVEHDREHNYISKVMLFRRYKFCVAMENSNTKDYVTEKMWHALEAGCLPIYHGAPNVDEFLPVHNAVLHYSDYGSPEKLMAEMVRLSENQTAYEEHMAWRSLPLEELNAGFRDMVLGHAKRRNAWLWTPRCELCKLLAAHRVRKQNYTTCLFNTTWGAAT